MNGRRVDAWVVDHPSVDGAVYELKQILDVLSVGPSAEVVGLAQWCSHRFAGPLRAVLTIASPPKRVKNLVVQKNLGADSLADWLRTRGFTVDRIGSRKGFRVLHVERAQ